MSSQLSSSSFTGQAFYAPEATQQQWTFQPSLPVPTIQQNVPRLCIYHSYQGYYLTDQQKQLLLGIKSPENPATPWIVAGGYSVNIELANLFRNTPYENWTDMVYYIVNNATNIGMFPWNLPENDKFIHKYELNLVTRGNKSSGTPWSKPCPICKKMEVKYVRQQIRSPDEPETTFFRCHACGSNWKDSC